MHRTKWEEYYRLYKFLEVTWKWNNAPYELNEQSFRDAATTTKDPSLITREMQRRGYGIQDSDQWEIALKLRDVILELPSGWFKDEPLEDVYQAPLRMEISERWRTKETKSQIFRGQRKYEWRVIPNMFREICSTNSKLNFKLETITGLVRQLQASDHNISDEEGVAIVQHYSAEVGIGTWLIDFTWDPFVALFFGSHHGQDGDVGQDNLWGYGGNDRIRGGLDDDVVQGLEGNDILEGGDGNDVLVGDWDTGPVSFFGADTLKGGLGDDKLFQSAIGGQFVLAPDGHKEILDCGGGNDEAFGNVNTDHDEFRN